MSVSEQDVKKLWGAAAGRCSKPGCEENCLRFLDVDDPVIIGEMAHVIAQSPRGPRGGAIRGSDTYDNLILLCPTHHKEVDKAPEFYSASMLHEWKQMHEENVRQAFISPKFSNLKELATKVKKLLIQNKSLWSEYGPESEEAKRNPISNLSKYWQLVKLATIVPNNQKIVSIIQRNEALFDLSDYQLCTQFIVHAEGFERNCYERTEGVPQFPNEFEELIDRYAEI